MVGAGLWELGAVGQGNSSYVSRCAEAINLVTTPIWFFVFLCFSGTVQLWDG